MSAEHRPTLYDLADVCFADLDHECLLRDGDGECPCDVFVIAKQAREEIRRRVWARVAPILEAVPLPMRLPVFGRGRKS